jgi:aspartate aminotransferase-like enzyme
MMRRKPQLRIPGPTPVPERVARAGSRPMIDHRSEEFSALLNESIAGIRAVMQTDQRVLLFPASGTGGLEAAVANLLSPGERVLFCTTGWFGELWADIAEAFQADVVRVGSSWGEPIDAGEVDRVLDVEPTISKVFVTHNETSMGTLNDIRAIAEVAKSRGCVIAVDSVSGLPCHPLAVDELGLDVVITSSQKGWLAPPGLTMTSVSDAALRAAAESRCPKYYFNYLRQAAAQANGQLHSTPPLSLMYALREGLAMIHHEGIRTMRQRHERIARMIRAAVRACGLVVVAPPGCASSTVTVVRAPDGIANWSTSLLSDLRRSFGVILADGLGHLSGKAFRIGHLGTITEKDVYSVVAAIEGALAPGTDRRSRHPQILRSLPRAAVGEPKRFAPERVDFLGRSGTWSRLSNS